MGRLKQLLRFWMTFESPVARREYVLHGAGLMALKYFVDAAVIGVASGSLWTPWSYLQTSPLELAESLDRYPSYLGPLLAVWTLPFMWVGVCMTMRRLLDARRSPWWALLFFVPPLSYLLMTALSVVPSREPLAESARPDPAAARIPAALSSIAIGAALGLSMLFAGAIALNSYGIALFLGTPFAVGAVTGFLLNRRYSATQRETFEVVAVTLLVVAGAALALGWEGAVCVLMAMPLSIVVALMGGAFGRAATIRAPAALRSVVLVPGILLGGLVSDANQSPGGVREVRSAVVIDAPPHTVWDNVVSFPRLPDPTELYFRLGVAYPTHAHIDGSGVGAVRYCEFSTGPFVEPITTWDVGSRLAFDVVSSPQPLRELSPYPIKPPHLNGFLTPVRGEFRLIRLEDGRTRLEGSTWYEQSLRPHGYWVVFSDYLIRRIHERVLHHIQLVTEGSNSG